MTGSHPFDAAMQEALLLAAEAARAGEVPVGAVAVLDGGVVGRGRNRREEDRDPCAHAELIALRDAARALSRWRLTGVTLVVTLEPCAMCAGALVLARIQRLVYEASDPRAERSGPSSTSRTIRASTTAFRSSGGSGPTSAGATASLLPVPAGNFRCRRGKFRILRPWLRGEIG